MNRKIINVTKSSMPKFEEYVEEIRALWDTHWLTNMGIKHKQLEEELLKFLKTKNITLFTNGHLALECGIAALELKGEVITTPFTFASTTHAIVRNGLKPVFCDINEIDYTIDVNKIEELITSETSAIIPVHVYGNICDVEKIEKLASKYNLKVLYDAAHAFGVVKDGIDVSNFGDISMYSFHATKVFNTIEGGALTYNNTNLKKVLNDIKNFGITGPETVDYIGGNAKMNEFQAAMGLCNLKHIDMEIEKRKLVEERYRSHLTLLNQIKLVEPQKGVTSNYSYFPILIKGEKEKRDNLYRYLEKNGIIARKYFYPLTSDFECYKKEYKSENTPVAKYISERILTLPLYADLELSEVDRICSLLARFFDY